MNDSAICEEEKTAYFLDFTISLQVKNFNYIVVFRQITLNLYTLYETAMSQSEWSPWSFAQKPRYLVKSITCRMVCTEHNGVIESGEWRQKLLYAFYR